MGPQINFYILQADSAVKAMHFACQLMAKAFQANQTVFVNASSKEEALQLDNYLWAFEEDSFLPHQLAPAASPILIGYEIVPADKREVLINFAQEVPHFYNEFKEIIEIVFSDPAVQQLARTR